MDRIRSNLFSAITEVLLVFFKICFRTTSPLTFSQLLH